jgi:hypothetical protein
MLSIRKLAVINASGLLLHICVAYATQFRLINMKDIGEVSDEYPSLFTPASSTFAIWGVIYILLIAFAAYHLFHAWKHPPDHDANRDLKKIGYQFAINNICAALWLIFWVHDQLLYSVLLILVLLVTLIILHQRLRMHNHSRSFANKTFTQLPLSVYLGWITVATIADISSWLTAIRWNGWNVSPINWALTMIAVTVLLTVGVINRKKNVAFGLVVIWGLYGIMQMRIAVDKEDYQPIIWLIQGGIVIIAGACLFGLIRNLRKK